MLPLSLDLCEKHVKEGAEIGSLPLQGPRSRRSSQGRLGFHGAHEHGPTSSRAGLDGENGLAQWNDRRADLLDASRVDIPARLS